MKPILTSTSTPTLSYNVSRTSLRFIVSGLLALSVFLSFSTNAFAAGPVCADLFSSAVGALPNQRPLEKVKQIKLMAYNVENMFLKLGKFVDMPEEQFKKISKTGTKPEGELRGLASAIIDENPDFIVLEEVEDLETLTAFSKNYLGGSYRPFLVEGNDQRGIQIGYLVKRDLPVQIALESHKDATWIDPHDHQPRLLFSRDAPALIVRPLGAAPDSAPSMIFIGNHAKAQTDRDGDPHSNRLRTAQMAEIASIVDDYQARYGKNVPIVVGGDFNVDVRQAADVLPIRERMVDPFDLKGLKGDDRVTHTYHPRNGPSEFHQLDALFVTPSLAQNVLDMEAYRYKNANGLEKRIPQSYRERSENPSDHFPIVLTLSTEAIFPVAFAKAN